MKTQIITLESHDDLISVRDRMSWAKSPRILLVWPAYEQIAVGALDLRILQQHARKLGAQLGLVTHRAEVSRNARSFGIPVFRSTADAQRGAWTSRGAPASGRLRRRRNRAAELRALREQLRSRDAPWAMGPIPRVGFFILGVLAVFTIASLFVPRATILLKPVAVEQSASLSLGVVAGGTSPVPTGKVPAQGLQINVAGSQTLRTESKAAVPKQKAAGIARFQNLGRSAVIIPAGTVVFSASPSSVRFATLAEARLEGRINSFADVEIEALEPGEVGNVPANAILGIQGALGAAISVTNPDPTAGGLDALEAVPSQADRERLRADLLVTLKADAGTKLASSVTEDDLLLADTLAVATIDEEVFEPPAGKPGSVLSLSMRVTYDAQYISGGDLRNLAEAALNASAPPEYAPQLGTLRFTVTPTGASESGDISLLSLNATRTVRRNLDLPVVNQLARGRSPAQAAGALQAALPLAAPPEIRLTPSWWPWLPLIPFRISVVIL